MYQAKTLSLQLHLCCTKKFVNWQKPLQSIYYMSMIFNDRKWLPQSTAMVQSANPWWLF